MADGMPESEVYTTCKFSLGEPVGRLLVATSRVRSAAKGQSIFNGEAKLREHCQKFLLIVITLMYDKRGKK